MVLSDFLSRQQGDDSDPYEIIPISFNMKEILKQIIIIMWKSNSWNKLDSKIKLVE